MTTDLGCRMGQVEQMIRYTYWTSGCKGIVVGLSGGVDSAVAATFCCRAVGGKKVLGLTLPSGVTKPEDIADAAMLCNQLGMEHLVISIEPILRGFQAMPDFKGSAYLLGNLMARIRMTVLYYQANLDNTLVCGTSNRSEYMLGYCTKFGDNAADSSRSSIFLKQRYMISQKSSEFLNQSSERSHLPVYGKDRVTKKRSVLLIQKSIIRSACLNNSPGRQQQLQRRRFSDSL